MDESGLPLRQFHKGTKIADAGDYALNHAANFNGQ
jgi:hypothetical protein